MRWVIGLLLQCGQGLNALHFNVRLALFGAFVCTLHTAAALALLCEDLIPSSTAEQVIDFSMSGTVFLLVGITVSAILPTLKGPIHVAASGETAEPRAPQNLARDAAGLIDHLVDCVARLEAAQPLQQQPPPD